MKKLHGRILALAGILLVSTVGAAFAQSVDSADSSASASKNAKAAVYSTSKAAKPGPSSATWDGFYVGGYAGVGLRRATANTTTVFSPTGYFAATSAPAVGTAGRQTLNSTNFNGGGTFG